MKQILACLGFATLLGTGFNLTLHAQGTAFTYQGRLQDGATLANGRYDFRFRLASDADGNAYVGSPVLTNALPVANGEFTAQLDFGTGIFTGSNFWLQIEVRSNGLGGYSVLSPLQQIAAAPYAITAGSVTSGGLPAGAYTNAVILNNAANQFTGSYSGDGSGLSGVNATQLGGLAASSFWKLGGNTLGGSQVFGSIDNQPVDFRVGNQRALRLQPNIASNAPNIIGGSWWNYVSNSVVGATIGGGGGVGTYVTTAAHYTEPLTNAVLANFGTVAGGGKNIASGDFATVGGGALNTADNIYATIAGGEYNEAAGRWATIGGGYGNVIGTNGYEATIGGGEYNTAQNVGATIPGGSFNTAGGVSSFAAGNSAQALHDGTFVWADDQSFSPFASTAVNQFLIRATGGVGINTNAPQATLDVNGTLRVGGTVFKNLQGGIAQMSSGSSTVKTNFTFTFPKAFSSVPKVILSPSSGNAVPVDDTFAVSVRDVTATTCTVNIVRVDTASGWSQQVKINWLAWE